MACCDKNFGSRIEKIEGKELKKYNLIAGVPMFDWRSVGIGKRVRVGYNHPVGQHVGMLVPDRILQYQQVNRDQQNSQKCNMFAQFYHFLLVKTKKLPYC